VKNIILTLSFSLSFLTCFLQVSYSQTISAADRKKLLTKEDTLRSYALYMITDTLPEDRMISDSFFTRTLVRALQVKNSFYYPFDSVFGISKLYAPDSSFRIFTWNLQFDDYYSRQKGAIQLRTPDGSLKLIPLRDNSEFSERPEDSVRGRNNWIGAIYYNIIKKEYKGKNYYTMFGLDHNSVNSNKKWVEVMYFNEKKEPVFGGPFFTYEQDSVPKKPRYRLSLEFKKNARVLANYIPDLDLILVDHLISETDQPELGSTMVPDGDNEGYKWENGKWVHIDKVFTLKLKDGEAPVEDPVLDDKGNRNEQKLKDRSDKNTKPRNNEKLPINYDN
jgi:hypothetical protein